MFSLFWLYVCVAQLGGGCSVLINRTENRLYRGIENIFNIVKCFIILMMSVIWVYVVLSCFKRVNCCQFLSFTFYPVAEQQQRANQRMQFAIESSVAPLFRIVFYFAEFSMFSALSSYTFYVWNFVDKTILFLWQFHYLDWCIMSFVI
jgi:hypothetical protein